jgi:hypothetical protein
MKVKFDSFNTAGQSLFEIVVALGVIALVVVALVLMSSVTIRNNNFARDKTLATRYSEEGIEWLRGERDAGFTVFAAHSSTGGSVYCLQSLDFTNVGACGAGEEIAGTSFKRELTLTTITVGTNSVIEAIVNAYWTDHQGTHNVKSATNFSDW